MSRQIAKASYFRIFGNILGISEEQKNKLIFFSYKANFFHITAIDSNWRKKNYDKFSMKVTSWRILHSATPIFYINCQNSFWNVSDTLKLFEEESQSFVNYIKMLKN